MIGSPSPGRVIVATQLVPPNGRSQSTLSRNQLTDVANDLFVSTPRVNRTVLSHPSRCNTTQINYAIKTAVIRHRESIRVDRLNLSEIQPNARINESNEWLRFLLSCYLVTVDKSPLIFRRSLRYFCIRIFIVSIAGVFLSRNRSRRKKFD